jgi:DNA polymerase-4
MKPDKFNTEKPLIMHVDLNSAFASIEQQSRPLLRGRSIAVVNRRTEHTAIVTASYEAKAYGVKVGMKFKEAARLVPGLVGIESDPSKYRYVYRKLMAILNDYSPKVVMRSIDEGVMDFHDLAVQRPLVEIGYEIKKRLREEVGIAMRCNVGIGPNRFLAKTAASLHKPDGLDVITAENLRIVYGAMKLTDLTGIACHMEERLNAVGIFTPLEFLDSSIEALEKVVFKSVIGKQWYQRLRGWEVDNVVSETKTVGRQYVLERYDLTRDEIRSRLHYLCESVGSRLRSKRKVARGVRIYVRTMNRQYWHTCQMCQVPFFSDGVINNMAQQMFSTAPDGIIEIGVGCYGLSDDNDRQMSLFYDSLVREQNLTGAIDEINRRFGEATIHSAGTLLSRGLVKQKVPFGSTRYL